MEKQLNNPTLINVCKCNNCESHLIDENPKPAANQYIYSGEELKMAVVDNYPVCPVCLTDDYLIDI